MSQKGIGGHHASVGKSQVWLTPPKLIDDLGPFDLDPCATEDQAHHGRPWPTAKRMYHEAEDGLSKKWKGYVWLNPPYDRRVIGTWMEKMSEHGNGIALLFARTDTSWWSRHIWGSLSATAVLFLQHRLTFHLPDGSPSKYNAGGPSCLVGYGVEAMKKLQRFNVDGCVATGWSRTFS